MPTYHLLVIQFGYIEHLFLLIRVNLDSWVTAVPQVAFFLTDVRRRRDAAEAHPGAASAAAFESPPGPPPRRWVQESTVIFEVNGCVFSLSVVGCQVFSWEQSCSCPCSFQIVTSEVASGVHLCLRELIPPQPAEGRLGRYPRSDVCWLQP